MKINGLALAMYKGCSDTILREVHLLEHNLKNIAVYDF